MKSRSIVHPWMRDQETVGQGCGARSHEGSKTRKRDATGRGRRNKTILEDLCHLLDLSVSSYGQCQAMTLMKDYLALCACSVSFPGGSVGKKSACNAGDTEDAGSIPGLERVLGGGNGKALQCSCLENPMDRGAWWATVHRVAKSWI